MFSPARLAVNGPANTKFHVHLSVRMSRLHVPYVRPTVTLTTRGGHRL